MDERIEKALEELDELMNEVNDLREEDDSSYSEETPSGVSSFVVKTPLGNIEVDLEEFESAKKRAKSIVNPPEFSLARRMTRAFIGGEDKMDFRYWNHNLGSLIKLHLDSFYSSTDLVKEFDLEGKLETQATYGNLQLGDEGSKRFIQSGYRFYERDGERFTIILSMDDDGDQRIVFITREEGRGLELLDELEEDFYSNGPLNGAFFDMSYNFMKRSEMVDELLAWNPSIRKQLRKDVLDFLRLMPILSERGLPNSRGIILSGAPGTGKTMYAKSLAAEAETTTILISAEMIQQRHDVKSVFKLARRLSPALIIIEDIDTAGTVSRKFTDHPILGEYLQAMDGMESNNGVVILATTNHTENIDPAISDRPGRFDRIIEVPLPDKNQRKEIIQNLMRNMPTKIHSGKAIDKIASKSKGLSGAWIREVVQTAMIEAISDERCEIDVCDLESGLKDVLQRRGMAYKPTPGLNVDGGRNTEVSVV
ncbi:MAG: AAA family ATPase [Candidatus Poseidoniales archaeon]|jgi:cell division protease FtsH